MLRRKRIPKQNLDSLPVAHTIAKKHNVGPGEDQVTSSKCYDLYIIRHEISRRIQPNKGNFYIWSVALAVAETLFSLSKKWFEYGTWFNHSDS